MIFKYTFIFIAVSLLSCNSQNKTEVNTSLISQHLTRIYVEELINKNIQNNELLFNSIDNDSLKANARIIQKLASKSINELQRISNELVLHCGGRDEFYELVRPFDKECVNEFLVTNNVGLTVKGILSNFETELENNGIIIDKIALDAEQIEVFKRVPELTGKTFQEYNFEQTTLIDALTRMTIFELYIVNNYTEYLSNLVRVNEKS